MAIEELGGPLAHPIGVFELPHISAKPREYLRGFVVHVPLERRARWRYDNLDIYIGGQRPDQSSRAQDARSLAVADPVQRVAPSLDLSGYIVHSRLLKGPRLSQLECDAVGDDEVYWHM